MNQGFALVVVRFLHQHFQLPSGADGLPLPVIVHIDQGQWRTLVQLADLGHPLLQLVVAVAIVVALPCLVVLPPFVVVVNANNKHLLC